jgi:hypothetical protein
VLLSMPLHNTIMLPHAQRHRGKTTSDGETPSRSSMTLAAIPWPASCQTIPRLNSRLSTCRL